MKESIRGVGNSKLVIREDAVRQSKLAGGCAKPASFLGKTAHPIVKSA
jgi:hypothetical protein